MDKGKTCFRQNNMYRDLEVGKNLVCMRKNRGKYMEQLCFLWTQASVLPPTPVYLTLRYLLSTEALLLQD